MNENKEERAMDGVGVLRHFFTRINIDHSDEMSSVQLIISDNTNMNGWTRELTSQSPE